MKLISIVSSHLFSTQTQSKHPLYVYKLYEFYFHVFCFIGKLPMINEMKISSRGPQIIVQSEEKLRRVGVRLSDLLRDTIIVFKAPSVPDVC